MKNAVLVVSLFLVGVAHADTKLMNEKLDELSLGTEVEEMEIFDVEAEQAATRRETRDLDRKARRLESQILRMKRKSTAAKSKISRLERRFHKSRAVAKRVEAQALEMEKKRNYQQQEVAKLEARVNAVESRAITARQKKLAANRAIKRGERFKTSLKRRLRKAESLVKRYKREQNRLRSRARKLSHSNQKFEQAVLKKERAAIKARQQRKQLARR